MPILGQPCQRLLTLGFQPNLIQHQARGLPRHRGQRRCRRYRGQHKYRGLLSHRSLPRHRGLPGHLGLPRHHGLSKHRGLKPAQAARTTQEGSKCRGVPKYHKRPKDSAHVHDSCCGEYLPSLAMALLLSEFLALVWGTPSLMRCLLCTSGDQFVLVARSESKLGRSRLNWTVTSTTICIMPTSTHQARPRTWVVLGA